jgi:hypothetical protein
MVAAGVVVAMRAAAAAVRGGSTVGSVEHHGATERRTFPSR